jgi:hypothetical protein
MSYEDIILNLSSLLDKVCIQTHNDKARAMGEFHRTQTAAIVKYHDTQKQALADTQNIICMAYIQALWNQDQTHEAKTHDLIQNMYLIINEINNIEIRTIINLQKNQIQSLIEIQNAQTNATNLVSCAHTEALAISLINQVNTCNQFNVRDVLIQADTMCKVQDAKKQALDNVCKTWFQIESKIYDTLNDQVIDQIIDNLYKTIIENIIKVFEDEVVNNFIIIELRKAGSLIYNIKIMTKKKIQDARDLVLYEIQKAKILAMTEIQNAGHQAIDEIHYDWDQTQMKIQNADYQTINDIHHDWKQSRIDI